MQTVMAISGTTQAVFEQVRAKATEVFPDSDAELRPSRFRDGEGVMVIIHTNVDGFKRRYTLIRLVRRFLKRLTKNQDVAIGFDVVIG